MLASRRSALLTLLVLGLLFLSGCLEGSSVRTGRWLPPKPEGARIDVYLESSPARPWEEIGRVAGNGSDWFATLTDVIFVLKDETRELGADAVIVTSHWVEAEETVDAYGTVEVHERVFAEGIAIRYRR